MKVLADFHHEELHESLRLLFCNRLKGEVYRPIGLEWFHEGFWKLHGTPNPHQETVDQYLKIYPGASSDSLGNGLWKFKRLNFWPYSHQLGIELEAAKAMDFDILIATIPEHFYAFTEFQKRYCPKAKVIFQSGNMWPIPEGVKNLLNSTAVPIPEGVNGIHYHPEFSFKWIYPGTDPTPKSVVSLQHFHPEVSRQKFFNLERRLQGWRFTEYGAGNRNGSVSNPVDEGAVYEDNAFLWHVKPCGEGYGFIAHKALATGRPIVCNYNLLKDCTLGQCLELGKTCIDVDLPEEDLARQLEDAQSSYPTWADTSRKKFLEVVNFDREFETIKLFLNRLQ